MHNYRKFFRNFVLVFPLISLIFSFEQLIGVLVEFQPDFINSISGEIIDDPETSGDGQFLTIEDLDLSFIQYQNVSKCTDPENFLVDKPPHNSDYFLLQMLAVKNYYNSISNNLIDFDIGVIDDVFQLDNNMKYYSTSESQIGLLFSESIDKVHAAESNETLFLKTIDKIDDDYEYNEDIQFNSSQDILYVVFHAGLGQESSTDFDPTIYDIRSAFVDDAMLNSEWSITNNISGGIVMPETLNMIYYDVIEDAIPSNAEENVYCNQQFGMVGLFAHLLGYSFGFPPLHNVDTGEPRVGVFDLMDIGFFNGRGVIPAPPSAWIRTNENFNNVNFSFDVQFENISENINEETTSYQLSRRLDLDKNDTEGSFIDKVYKIDISNNEYFLIENRLNTLGYNIDNVDDLYDLNIKNIILDQLDLLPEWFVYKENHVPAWFDIMNQDRSDYFEIDGNNIIPEAANHNVITFVDNYDSGLPGSGLLIWHIDEPVYNNGYEYGINDALFNKAIALEEGDGSVDIGDLDLTYGIWSNQKFFVGDKDDLWDIENEAYKDNNYINGYNNSTSIYFNSNSFPDSRTKNGVLSNISLRVKTAAGTTMGFEVQTEGSFYNQDIIYLDEDDEIIGNNGSGCIYYLNTQNEIFKYCKDDYEHCIWEDGNEGALCFHSGDDDVCDAWIDVCTYTDTNTDGPSADDTCLDGAGDPCDGFVAGTDDATACSNLEDSEEDCLALDPPSLGSQLYFEYGEGNKILASTDPNDGSSDYSLFNIENNSIINPQILYYDGVEYLIHANSGYYFNEENDIITNALINPMGKTYDSNVIIESENALSLGNIDDNDEFHELVYINNGNLIIENYNTSSVNGFPIIGDYSGIPLILNINNESSGPEIICINGDKVDVLSNKGQLLYELSYFGNSTISALMWGTDDVALIIGYRIYIYEDVYDESLSYWMNPYSRPSNYPLVTGAYGADNEENNLQSSNNGVDLSRIYNYPNPVEENSTKFRFYVYTSNSVIIDIYDIAGYKVITLNKSQLTHNEYNEILWESINLPPGLYFASVKSDMKQTKVLKVVIQ